MNEIWKDIPNYKGFYQASNLGNIRTVKHKRCDRNQNIEEKILKKALSNGYHIVHLCKNGKTKNERVHRLVLQAFVKESTLQVDHINGNKLDNRLINLEYVTPKENTNRAWKNGQSKPFNKRKVLQYDLDGNFIKEWESVRTFLKSINKSIKSGNINNCCNGRAKTAYGYKWKFGDKN